MERSTEFDDFCEDTVYKPDGWRMWQLHPGYQAAYPLHGPQDTLYDVCRYRTLNEPAWSAKGPWTAIARGFVHDDVSDAIGDGCRVIVPARCASGLSRYSGTTCRSYQRREWKCAAGRPRNEFNTCYVEDPDIGDPHPACVNDAPRFPVSDCAAYVDSDYVRVPISCAEYGGTYDGKVPLSDVVSNAHWCEYSTLLLNIDCHRDSATCPDINALDANAMCIQRASKIGGCDAIANTIMCHVFQARLDQGEELEEYEKVARQDCAPCTVMPFDPPSADCPAELSADHQPYSGDDLSRVHIVGEDSFQGRRGTPCADPPSGRIEARISHESGLALVNTPIVVDIIQSELQQVERQALSWDDPGFIFRSVSYLSYPTDPDNPTLSSRYWPQFDPTAKYFTIPAMMNVAGGTCYVNGTPSFRLLVEQLWPDTDRAEITRLFGSSALEQWDILSPEDKRAISVAHGFEFIEDPAAPEASDELQRRARVREEEYGECNHSQDSGSWCRWLPTSAGYFRLKVAAAWSMLKRSAIVAPIGDREVTAINSFLANELEPMPDGSCTAVNSLSRSKDYECLMEDILNMVSSVEEAGFNHDLRSIRTVPDGNDLYRLTAPQTWRCPSQDIRIMCRTGTSPAFNYTETGPIGIIVHEARVITQAPEAGP